MLTFQTEAALDDTVMACLRAALESFSEDAAGELAALSQAVAQGEMQAGIVQDGGGVLAVAVWGWDDDARRYASVAWLAVTGEAPAEASAALIDGLWDHLVATGARMIGARVRGAMPDVRAALTRREAVIFERHFMLANLQMDPLPEPALPPGYRVVPWDDMHQPGIEALAVLAMAGSADQVVLADAQPDRIGSTLRAIRAGTAPDMGPWLDDASFVVLDAAGALAGYIGLVNMGVIAFVVDIAVHPDHRRKGLARCLMLHAMRACHAAGFNGVGLAVTAGNPAVRLYESLGFRILQTGETAVWWHDRRQHG